MHPQVQHLGAAETAAAGVLSRSPSPPEIRLGRRELLLLVGLVAAGALLRVAAASARELWLDETHSALLAGLPLPRLWTFVRGDVHPPLYFLGLAGWTRLFGDTPAALRGFSLFVSLLGGPVAYLAAARLTASRTAGMLGAGLFLTIPVLVVYSVEVRMYAMAILLVTVALALLPRPGTEWSPRTALGFGVVAVLACLTHYMALFVVGGVMAWLVLRSYRNRGGLRPILTAALVIAVGLLPWTPVLLRQRDLKRDLRTVELAGTLNPAALSYGSTANATPTLRTRIKEAVENAASTAGVAGLEPRPLGLLLSLPVFVAAAAVLVGGLRGLPASRLFLMVGLAVALGCLAVGATARRFMILAVPFWITALAETWLTARGSGRRTLADAGAGGVVGVFLLGALMMAGEKRPAPFSESVSYLASRYRAGDLVVFDAAYAEVPFTYHARRVGFRPATRGFPVSIHDWWAEQDFKGWGGPVITETDLASFLDAVRADVGEGTLWLVLFETRYYDPRNRLRAELERVGRPVAEPFVRPGTTTVGYRFQGA